jgi:hypothetical protein
MALHAQGRDALLSGCTRDGHLAAWSTARRVAARLDRSMKRRVVNRSGRADMDCATHGVARAGHDAVSQRRNSWSRTNAMTKRVDPCWLGEGPSSEARDPKAEDELEAHAEYRREEDASGTRPVCDDGPFVTVEEVFDNDGLTRRGWVGWWSEQAPHGMAYGQSVKDEHGRSRYFPSADAAKTAAEQEGERQMNQKKPRSWPTV